MPPVLLGSASFRLFSQKASPNTPSLLMSAVRVTELPALEPVFSAQAPVNAEPPQPYMPL
jgi:hypothetical protein